MMHPGHLLIAAALVTFVHADLTCLEWGLISPLVGIFCHFEPSGFHTAEQKSASIVTEAVESAKNLVEFDLTHNPVAVTYNFVEESQKGGLGQGEEYLHNVTTDFRDLTIGFGKETANQAIQIYNLAHWNDISLCLISSAGQKAFHSAHKRIKRAGRLSVDEGVAIAKKCISDRFKSLAQPAVFHVNGSNQRIGSTISDLASLLVPIGAEGEVAAAGVAKTVDLVIPGSEESTRIYKLVGDKSAHFANEQEALSTAAEMKDPAWAEKNCAICQVPRIVTVGVARQRVRRGNAFSSCCHAPLTIKSSAYGSLGQASSDFSVEASAASSGRALDVERPYTSSIYQTEIPEILTDRYLVPAPKYELRRVSWPGDVEKISEDLRDLSTSVVAWDKGLIEMMSSEDLFRMIRNAFVEVMNEQIDESSLATLLHFKPLNGVFRFSSFSGDWIHSTDAALRPIIQFAKAAVDKCGETVARLKHMTPEQSMNVRGNVEIFYTPPSTLAKIGVDPRGLHADNGLMQFISQDTPGLVIQRSHDGTLSRVDARKDTFYLTKSTFWDLEGWISGTEDGPTWHTTFGPEIMEKGHVSMVVNIYDGEDALAHAD